jgi:formylglycine-generating enzyme required for sulfatase activity
MFAAVTGYDPTHEKYKQAKAPVNVSCVDMYKFCERLSEKTGRKVRIPTAAQWEYAARCGTSNPEFSQKYQAQLTNAKGDNRPP